MNYWEGYYQKNSPENTPWTGPGEKFFTMLWEKYNLPKTGNILDVGCGRGDKAIYLAKLGFKVWAFDISETAINDAKKASENMDNPPTFFVSSSGDFSEKPEIKDVKFDVIIDFVVSQFFEKDEKNKYLNSLQNHINSKETFYILTSFVKDNDKDPMEGYVGWVKGIAQSPKMIEESYLKYFDKIDEFVSPQPKGKVGRYILKAKVK